MKGTVITVVVCALGTVHKDYKNTGEAGNQRKNRNHPDPRIFKIGWNILKTSGDLQSLRLKR